MCLRSWAKAIFDRHLLLGIYHEETYGARHRFHTYWLRYKVRVTLMHNCYGFERKDNAIACLLDLYTWFTRNTWPCHVTSMTFGQIIESDWVYDTAKALIVIICPSIRLLYILNHSCEAGCSVWVGNNTRSPCAGSERQQLVALENTLLILINTVGRRYAYTYAARYINDRHELCDYADASELES